MAHIHYEDYLRVLETVSGRRAEPTEAEPEGK